MQKHSLSLLLLIIVDCKLCLGNQINFVFIVTKCCWLQAVFGSQATFVWLQSVGDQLVPGRPADGRLSDSDWVYRLGLDGGLLVEETVLVVQSRVSAGRRYGPGVQSSVRLHHLSHHTGQTSGLTLPLTSWMAHDAQHVRLSLFRGLACVYFLVCDSSFTRSLPLEILQSECYLLAPTHH